MADDNDLEKRAIEELLRETTRARARVETMGPSGWMKCPLRSTNKRFLVNTLRSSGLQRRSAGPTAGRSAARGRLRSDSLPGDGRPDGSPPRESSSPASERTDGRHRDQGRRCERGDGHKSGHFHGEVARRDRRPAAKDIAADTRRLLTSGHSSSSSSCSSRGHTPPRECSRGSQWGRTRSRSPVRSSQSGRSPK
ncbi:unnamed protein product [Merluccius merluccius]